MEQVKAPSNTVGYIVSMSEINDATQRILDELAKTEIPRDHVSALGFLNLSLYLLRLAGAPPETVQMLVNVMITQYEKLPNSGVQGRVLTAEELKNRPESMFMAPGNDTLN